MESENKKDIFKADKPEYLEPYDSGYNPQAYVELRKVKISSETFHSGWSGQTF